MITRAAVLLLLAALTASAQYATVVFNLDDHVFSGALSNRTMRVTPHITNGLSVGELILTRDRRNYVSDSNGVVTVTNMYGPLNYTCEVLGPYTNTVFQITVPLTNATLNASALKTVSTNGVVGAVTQDAGDVRYVLRSNGVALNLTLSGTNGTNMARFEAPDGYYLRMKGSNVYATSVSAGAGNGTVTSVAITAPTSVFDISGSPVTESGTLALTFDSQSANTVFAGPSSGGATTPTFRALVAGDIPALPYQPPSAVTTNLSNTRAITNVSSTYGRIASDTLYAPESLVATNIFSQVISNSGNASIAGALGVGQAATLSGGLWLTSGGAGRVLTAGSDGEVTPAQTIPFADNVRQTFNPGASAAGINVGSHAGDPSSPSNGDFWYNSSANEMKARINGSTVTIGAAGSGTDENAIHDNASGEISAVTAKATPVAADFLLIEDSAASNAKKSITVSALETALEGFLDLQELQGAVTDAQVPNTITVDLATLATTATTANAGDSATAFFSAGTIEDARLPATLDGKNLTTSTATTPAAEDNDGSIATTQYVQTELAQITKVGVYRNIWIPAGAMTPAAVNGSATGSYAPSGADGATVDVFDFDDTTAETNFFTVAMPDEWGRGTIKAKVYWTSASGSGGVTWGIQAGALSDDDPFGAILGTEVEVDDTLLASNDLHVSAATGAITVGGSPALGDIVLFKIDRDPGDTDDTKAGDARLIGVMIQYLETSTEQVAW
jgi:hypothetical protein